MSVEGAGTTTTDGHGVGPDTVAALRTNRTASLEDVFAEVTRQEDVSETVGHIVNVVRTW